MLAATANPRTRQSSPAISPRESVAALTVATRIFAVHQATANPSTPPTRPTSRLSTATWRNSRVRLAPMAARTANSRWRTTPRARSRLATLAHAINRTRPAMVNRATRAGCASRWRISRPREPGSSRTFF